MPFTVFTQLVEETTVYPSLNSTEIITNPIYSSGFWYCLHTKPQTYSSPATRQLSAGSCDVWSGAADPRRSSYRSYAHVCRPAGPMGKPYRRTRTGSHRYSRLAIENGPANRYEQPVVRDSAFVWQNLNGGISFNASTVSCSQCRYYLALSAVRRAYIWTAW
jgi:hypothetical protein